MGPDRKHLGAGPDTLLLEVWTYKVLVGADIEQDPDNRIVGMAVSQLSGHRAAVVVHWAWPGISAGEEGQLAWPGILTGEEGQWAWPEVWLGRWLWVEPQHP